MREIIHPKSVLWFGGTGLGRSICARLTEMMGGTIRVDRTPGQGFTFHVALTFALADPDAPEATVEAPALLAGEAAMAPPVSRSSWPKITKPIRASSCGNLTPWGILPAEMANDGLEALDRGSRASMRGC